MRKVTHRLLAPMSGTVLVKNVGIAHVGCECGATWYVSQAANGERKVWSLSTKTAECPLSEAVRAGTEAGEVVMEFCDNVPCEGVAVAKYLTEGGVWFALCSTCKDAFELGQANFEAELLGVDDDEE